MTYRVAFAKRFQSDGRESALDPTADLDVYLADGVVVDKVFVERLEPSAQHNQEVLDEDDAFLGLAGTEVWEYEVVNERASDFEDAIRNSQTVMEFEVTDSAQAEPDDSAEVSLGDGDTKAIDELTDSDDVSLGGSGVRAGDGGPAGQPTGDPSAGDLQRGKTRLALDEVEGIDELRITNADDPKLGLTNRGKRGPQDRAADTGPNRIPDRGIESDGLTDTGSTLRPGEPARRQR